MLTATAEQLRESLDQYLTLAGSGETVVVATGDHRVVVEFRPAREVPPWVTDPDLADLIRSGVASAPTRPPGAAPPRSHRLIPHEQLTADLERDREDRC